MVVKSAVGLARGCGATSGIGLLAGGCGGGLVRVVRYGPGGIRVVEAARFRGVGRCRRCGSHDAPMMLLCSANRLLGEPVLVSGGELVVVVEASFEL